MKNKIVTHASIIKINGKYSVDEKGYYIDEEAKEICELTNTPFPQAYSLTSGAFDSEIEAAQYLEVRVTEIPYKELDKLR